MKISLNLAAKAEGRYQLNKGKNPYRCLSYLKARQFNIKVKFTGNPTLENVESNY